MKMLGLGIPELTILLGIPLLLIVIIVIVVLVILKVTGASKASAPTTPPTITAEEFEQYSKLHEAGALTKEEFDAIRKRYLGL